MKNDGYGQDLLQLLREKVPPNIEGGLMGTSQDFL